jgi:Dolichyl-phosphate-mannose-protein mannosyltransferase
MNAALVLLLLIVSAGILFAVPNYAQGALMMCALFSVPTVILLARGSDRKFLLRLFSAALIVRLVIGSVIYLGRMQEFFGGDAITYDAFGQALMHSWHGDLLQRAIYQQFVSSGAGAWGMLYLVAIVYELIGRNMLAIQFINAALGAATAAVIYRNAQHLFNNIRVSRLAAALTAFFPSLILWSSQGLKDGLIVISLALAMLATIRLMDRVTFGRILMLTACLLALMSLRFYIFYMMIVAVVGAFVIGLKAATTEAFLQRFVAIVGIGLALTWFGVLRSAGAQFERFGNIDAVYLSRLDMARSAESGFAKDVDIRTTEGALTIIPIGVIYLLFAPFPWQLESLRQLLTLPEMLVWWGCFPLLVLGLWFAMRHRLREVSPILLFTAMLTLVYSVFQGNVGTAYRQRSQLLVFYFIFVAVGGILLREKMEDRQRERVRAKQELAERRAARVLARRRSLETHTGS